MSYGVCNCTIGPPAGSVCAACGIQGPPLYSTPAPAPVWSAPNTIPLVVQQFVSLETVKQALREVLREERA